MKKSEIIISALSLFISLPLMANSYYMVVPVTGAEKTYSQLEKETAWLEFAGEHSVTPGTDWNNFMGANRGIVSLPNAPYPNSNPTGDLQFSDNSITSIEAFGKLETVGGYLNLTGNDFTSLDGLVELNDVQSIGAADNNNLTDISKLSSLTPVTTYLDNREYTIKAEENSPFCIAMEDGSISVQANNGMGYVNANIENVCEVPFTMAERETAWANYATSNGLTYEANWEGLDWRNQGLTELPLPAFPNESPENNFFIAGNPLTSIESLSGIKGYTGTGFALSDLDISSLDGLENLLSARYLEAHNNPNLTDVSALRNIWSVNFGIYLDDRDYAVKAPGDSVFCTNTRSGSITVETGFGGSVVPIDQFCEPAP